MGESGSELTREQLEEGLYFYRAKCVRVVDGDTLDLEVDLGMRTFRRDRFRLYGIDTPETYGVKKDSEEYSAGMRATTYVKMVLEPAVGEEPVDIWLETHKDDTGKYGRYLATIWYAAVDEDGEEDIRCLNDDLVENGFAEERSY